MPSLKEVRVRISSIKATRKITSAMKMVAASRLHKSQHAISHLRHYAAHLKQMLVHVNQSLPLTLQSPYTSFRSNPSALVVSIASNKGLCGAYNTFVAKKTLEHIRHLEESDQQVSLMLVGKKNEAFFRKKEFPLLESDNEAIDRLSLQTAKEFATKIMDLFMRQNLGRVDIVYHKFRNAVVQELTTEQILPVPQENLIAEEISENPEAYGYILEPAPEQVVQEIVHDYVTYNVYRILLDAAASEHGARMTAMHKATDNADELLRTLTITYNKVRQTMITREISEIVGAAEALKR